MKLDIGDLKLFGIDFARAGAWWWQGLSAERRLESVLQYFLKPSPVLEVLVQGEQLVFRFAGAGGEPTEVARVPFDLSDEADDIFMDAILASQKVRRDLVQLELVLPRETVLSREMLLPHEVRGHLREVVGYQLSRLTPFSADQLFYDVEPDERASADSDQLAVQFLAVARASVEPLIARVERLAGMQVSRLGVAGYRDANLFAARRVSTKWWRRLNLNSGLALLLACSLVGLMLAPVLKERQLVIERKQMIATLNAEVRDLMEKRSNLDASLSGLNYILDKRAAVALPTETLAEVTRVVPDDIYITSYRVQGNNLVMNGSGTNVVDLIQKINASDRFADARFSAPINRNRQTGLDQFVVNVRVLPDSPQESVETSGQ